MEKINLPPFYVGQKVVYITGINMPKDSVHTVLGIIHHPCGCYSIDIGRRYSNTHKRSSCFTHQHAFVTINNNIRYVMATSFRPLQEQTFPLLTYSKVLEEVPLGAN